MTVILPGDWGAFWAPAKRACDLCGEPVAEARPAVFWSCPGDLLFHPECAALLGPHLIADAREAQLAAGLPGWARRAARAAGAALRRQETAG